MTKKMVWLLLLAMVFATMPNGVLYASEIKQIEVETEELFFCNLDDLEIGRAEKRYRSYTTDTIESLYEALYLYFPEEAYLDELCIFMNGNMSSDRRMVLSRMSEVMPGLAGEEIANASQKVLVEDYEGDIDLYAFPVRRLLEPGLYEFAFWGYTPVVRNKVGEVVILLYGEAEEMQEMTPKAHEALLAQQHEEQTVLEEAERAQSFRFPLATFNGELLFDSDPSTGWRVWTDSEEIYCTFYVHDTVTIQDFYFSTEFENGSNDFNQTTPIAAPNCFLEFKTYDSLAQPTVVVKTVPAQVAECPPNHPFVHNDFTQLTGASGINLTLERGVYYVHIIPLAAAKQLNWGTRRSVSASEYGVGATGTGQGSVQLFLPEQSVALTPLILGVQQNKSLSEITDVFKVEIKIAEEARRAAEEAARKAAAEKAAREAAAAAAATTAAASKPIALRVDGKTVPTDSPPIIEDGRTLAPLRAVVESLGYILVWEASTQTISIYEPVHEILVLQMKVGSRVARGYSGIYDVMTDITLDVPAKIINGRTMVPVRFIAEALGCIVKWDDKDRVVIILVGVG